MFNYTQVYKNDTLRLAGFHRKNKLLDWVCDRMRLKDYAYRTEKSYLYCIELLPNKAF